MNANKSSAASSYRKTAWVFINLGDKEGFIFLPPILICYCLLGYVCIYFVYLSSIYLFLSLSDYGERDLAQKSLLWHAEQFSQTLD